MRSFRYSSPYLQRTCLVFAVGPTKSFPQIPNHLVLILFLFVRPLEEGVVMFLPSYWIQGLIFQGVLLGIQVLYTLVLVVLQYHPFFYRIFVTTTFLTAIQSFLNATRSPNLQLSIIGFNCFAVGRSSHELGPSISIRVTPPPHPHPRISAEFYYSPAVCYRPFV